MEVAACGHDIVNAELTYMRDSWMFQAYGTNLLNDFYVAGSTGRPVGRGRCVNIRRGLGMRAGAMPTVRRASNV